MKPLLNLRMPLALTAALLISCAAMQAKADGKPVNSFKLSLRNPVEEEPAAKAKVKTTRAFSSLNNKTIKLYPDAIRREMHVVSRENDGQEIDFFVFDVQGTLVEHYKMKPKDHYRIAGLARGKYIYRVFRGDAENAAGQFEIF
jgi:hypothetical protein